MEEGELSEGEIVSDDNEEEEAADSGPNVPKKAKLDKKKPRGRQMSSGRSLNRHERKRLKKEQRKRERRERRQTSRIFLEEFLSKKGEELLKKLAFLCKGQVPPQSNTLLLKTVHFQSVILHLVLGSPSQSSHLKLPGTTSLRENRVVVVWLSLVTAKFFTSSEEHFRRLKSLNPMLQFNIEHPGSKRFAKLGLEAFLMKTKEEQKEDCDDDAAATSGGFTRADCLLSMVELNNNGYPVPQTAGQASSESRDVSQYLQITKWPHSTDAFHEAGGFPIFAVDCEMVTTANGLELARVSIINESLKCIYDTFVKPSSPVMDYKTKFSGIDESMLSSVTTTLADVHKALGSILPSNCILAGHSLENDLHALKMIHPYAIDTSVIFTPYAGPLSKPSLRMLTKKLLKTDIQMNEGGHDSIEDASSCMQLVQLKLTEGPRCTVPWNDERSILTEISSQGHAAGIVDKQGVVNLFGKALTNSCIADSDDEVVQKAKGLLPQCDFTFLQLHAIENFLKSGERDNKGKLLEVVESMDANVMRLVEECPSKSLVFVVCGSSDIREVKRLYQQSQVDYMKLEQVVMVARTGLVLAFLVN